MPDRLLEREAAFREQLQKHLNSTVNCLIHFCELNEREARQIVEDSHQYTVNNYSTDPKTLQLLGEDPYFLAMSIFYAPCNPQWFENPDLWPPPDNVVILYDL